MELAREEAMGSVPGKNVELGMNVLLGNVVPEKGAFPNELVGNEDSGAFMLYGAP